MSGQIQGTEGFKEGNLKFYLPSATIALLDPTKSNAGESTFLKRVSVRGLSGCSRILVNAGLNDGTNLPKSLPTGGLTMQIYPAVRVPDGGGQPVYGRPVFQDPTATDNANHPLPVDLPFGWEGPSTSVDELLIEITSSDLSQWNGTNLNGQIVVNVIVEYNGAWWDQQAIQLAMSKVTLQQVEPGTIGTHA